MKTHPKSFYTDLLQQNDQLLQKLHTQIRRLSTLRILSFLLAAFTVYLFADSGAYLWLVACFLLLLVFMSLVLHHQRLIGLQVHHQARSAVLQNELDALVLQPKLYADGSRFLHQLPFADDLDLFGENSLFRLLNRCTSPGGEAMLANGLIHTSTDADAIRENQVAVKQLAAETDFRIEMLTLLQRTREQKAPDVETLQKEEVKLLFSHGIYRLMRVFFPLFSVGSLLFGLITNSYQLFSMVVTIVLIAVFSQAKKMGQLSAELDGLQQQLKIWAQVLAKFSELKVEGTVLLEMQQNARGSAKQLKQLAKLSEGFDRRANLIWYVLANGIFAYDLQLALRFEKWKTQHMLLMPEWLDTLARLETVLSIAAFADNNPAYCWPQSADSRILRATELRHPLMLQSQCVANHIDLEDDPRIVLVTGSNMSGKSTWLRTLGVNLLLAQLGAPVNAKAFHWKPMLLLSSLRQSDSLAENTSLFMHELKQLKYILDTAQKQFCLILLDEILRGTNSDDKYSGSYALLKRLACIQSFTVMATHDLKLSELEQEIAGKLVNYCFESEIRQGKLLFDYTIRPGVAVNRNATWLMRDMGIIGDV